MRALLYISFFFFPLLAQPAVVDTAFIARATQYAAKALGLPQNQYYTSWVRGTEPAFVLFVSKTDTVQSIPEIRLSHFSTNRLEVDSLANRHRAKGHDVFIYHAYGDSRAKLHPRYADYSREEICFIVFHELAHHYTFGNLWLPYAYHEAMCDVIAAHLTLKFAGETRLVDVAAARRFVRRTERIYKAVNTCTRQISRNRRSKGKYQRHCEKRIARQLQHVDSFMLDRFQYPINNGYLLKNGNYATYYFKLKKWLHKDGDLDAFLKRMVALFPKAPDNKQLYLQW